MTAFTKFQPFVENLAEKVFNLGSDVLKAALSNNSTTPASTFSNFASITEIAAGNGYTAGGATLTITSSAQSGGTYTLIISDQSWTASAGSIADFRYVILYDDTAASDQLIGMYDFGSTVTVTVGNSFLVDFDGTNGVLKLS